MHFAKVEVTSTEEDIFLKISSPIHWQVPLLLEHYRLSYPFSGLWGIL
jgi:hypothetical protein